MRRLAIPLALVLPVILASAEDKAPKTERIQGNVINASKVLQPEVEIGLVWTFNGAPAAVGSWKTDAKGHFDYTFKKWPGNVVLFAMDADRKQGCLLPVDGEAAKKPLTLALAPLKEVKGTVTSTDPTLPAAAELSVAMVEGGAVIATAQPGPSGFTLQLPPGKYAIRLRQDKMRPLDREIELTAKKDLDLGDLKLVPFPIAVGLGKTLPLFSAAAVRGGKPDLQISDYKGKYVLVLFWGSWCNTSSTQWMPNLIEFNENMKSKYSNFQILSYHDGTAKSLAEMDAKLAKHGKLHWDPKNPPFPLLLDRAEGGTVADWGVTGEPTVLLFDTEGRFMKQDRDYLMLESAIKGELK